MIFRPVKAHFNKITQHLKLATSGSSNPINCSKTNFTRIFKEPWESVTVALIKKGFQKCGISPLDRDAIDKSRLSGKSANTNSPKQQSAATSNPNQQPTTSSNQQLHQRKTKHPQWQHTVTHLWQLESSLQIYIIGSSSQK